MKEEESSFWSRILQVKSRHSRYMESRSPKPVARKLRLEFLENRELLSADSFCNATLNEWETIENSLCECDFSRLSLVERDSTLDLLEVAESEYSDVDSMIMEMGGTPEALSENFVFSLNSKPDSQYTIYLDFTGHDASSTSWRTYGKSFITPTYSIDDDASFSNVELRNIFQIWATVSEDFLPFNVNVTTEEPSADRLKRVGSKDTEYGVRCCIGGSYSDWYKRSSTGIAFTSSFNASSDLPCFVFSEDCRTVKRIADVASHEIGHTFGLKHDGCGSDAYYAGHNDWAPIMGSSYNPLTQWSKGEYEGATNLEDDLAIISSGRCGVGYRADDHGDSIEDATLLELVDGRIGSGIIERNTDYDYFAVDIEPGKWVALTIGGYESVTNLDVAVELYDYNGTLLETFNPNDSMSVEIDFISYDPGRYYFSVTGAGRVDANGVVYSDYGSLGFYMIDAVVVDSSILAPNGVVATSEIYSSISVRWNVVEGAEAYRLEVYNDASMQEVTTITTTDAFATVEGLAPSTQYKLLLYSRDSDGAYSTRPTSAVVRTAERERIQLPSPNLSCACTYDSFTLSWDPVEEATGYVLQYSYGTSRTPITVNLDSSTTRFAMTGLQPNDYFYSRVRAIGDDVYILSSGWDAEYIFLDPKPLARVDASAEPISSNVSAPIRVGTIVLTDWVVAPNLTITSENEQAAQSLSIVGNYVRYHGGLTASDVPYRFTLRASNDKYVELADFELLIVDPLAAPTGLTASTTVSTATIEWEPAEGATSYRVDVYDGEQNVFSTVATETSCVATGLVGSTDYQISVVARSDYFESSASTITATTKALRKLPKPNVLANPTSHTIELSWNANAKATGYSVRYKVEGASSYTIVFVQEPYYTIENLKSSTSYVVGVRNNGDNVEALNSDHTFIQPIETLCDQSAPQLTATATTTATTAKIAMSANCPVDEFQIVLYQGNNEVGSYATTDEEFTIDLLTPSTAYVASIVARVDGAPVGEPFGVEFSTTEPRKLVKLVVTIDATTNNSISLSWNAVPKAIGYTVSYRKENSTLYKLIHVNELSCTIEGLEENTSYYVRVRADADGVVALTSDNRANWITTSGSNDEGTTSSAALYEDVFLVDELFNFMSDSFLNSLFDK